MKYSFGRNSLKYSINEKFFDRWSSQMAYILGFTFADGNIYRTSLGWDIQKRDLNILEKINKALDSTYPIKERRKSSYRLRINNQILVRGAIKKGLLPKKSLRLKFPKVPQKFIRYFIRGYLDGDGWIVHRTGRNEFDLGFVCGNKYFLSDLLSIFEKRLGVSGRVRKKTKITPRGFKSKTYLLEYYGSSSVEIADWLYGNLDLGDICLERKYQKYLEAKIIYNRIFRKMKTKKQIQREFRKPIKEILFDLIHSRNLSVSQAARYLRTSGSSVYRWLS